MLSDNEVKIKFEKLSNKLQAGLFTEVINEALVLLKKDIIRFFLIFLVLHIKALVNLKNHLILWIRHLK